MNVVGIISEFNPLHNGHQYLMKQAKELTEAQYVILVMSGNYVQRGLPAFLEKDFRVKAALNAGADMVIELPIPFATASAEYFAAAGVSILHQLGFVTHLAFGSEEGHIRELLKVSRLLESEETEEYKSLLKELLASGMVYAKAREEALKIITNTDLHSILSKPNNALGLSYLKAIHDQQSGITPVTVKRIGKDYDDTTLSRTGFSSASGIRAQIAKGKIDAVLYSIPESTREDFRQLMDGHYDLDEDAFSLPLLTKLQEADKETLLSYFDVTPALADKLIKQRHEQYLYSNLA
ncbi:MAG: nucleotidyltransferase family protein, partial [Lachnospiraceae bacterium]|nr:nucleotidyltransferase family protein [Lachnospiraceae bacterium]